MWKITAYGRWKEWGKCWMVEWKRCGNAPRPLPCTLYFWICVCKILDGFVCNRVRYYWGIGVGLGRITAYGRWKEWEECWMGERREKVWQCPTPEHCIFGFVFVKFWMDLFVIEKCFGYGGWIRKVHRLWVVQEMIKVLDGLKNGICMA